MTRRIEEAVKRSNKIMKLKKALKEAKSLAREVLRYSHGDDLSDLHDSAWYFLMRNKGVER